MDSVDLSLIANLGIGGVMTYIMFMIYRTTVKEHADTDATNRKEHREEMKALIERQGKIEETLITLLGEITKSLAGVEQSIRAFSDIQQIREELRRDREGVTK